MYVKYPNLAMFQMMPSHENTVKSMVAQPVYMTELLIKPKAVFEFELSFV